MTVTFKTGKPNQLPLEDGQTYGIFVAGNGVFAARRNKWFTSVAPSNRPLDDVPCQNTFCQIRYPKLTTEMVEQMVGYFYFIYDKYDAESALLIGLNRKTEQLEFVCPTQVTSSTSLHVDYDRAAVQVAHPHLVFIGDAHSHCNFGAYSSGTDDADSKYGAGLHIIAGHLDKADPPQLYCEFWADGQAFIVVPDDAMNLSDYKGRIKPEQIPAEWLKNTKIKKNQGVKHHSPTSWDDDDDGMYPQQNTHWDTTLQKYVPNDASDDVGGEDIGGGDKWKYGDWYDHETNTWRPLSEKPQGEQNAGKARNKLTDHAEDQPGYKGPTDASKASMGGKVQ